MPRRGSPPRRPIVADPVYGSELVTQMINKVLQRGKRSVAERIVYTAIDTLNERSNGQGVEVLDRAISNARPEVEVKSRRVGGATYQVPVEVKPDRATALAIRWIVGYARDRRERTMAERLANEIMDTSNNAGSASKRREDTHRMAEANKAFAHYRW